MKKQFIFSIAFLMAAIMPAIAQTDNDDATDLRFTVGDVSFTMKYVEGGTFNMGSSDYFEDERPVHSVTLNSYYIGQTEVTQALWKAVMGENPSKFKGDDNLPVERVSWNDCQTFVSKLNGLTGKIFRLPTEAEWEFAAKGGNSSKGCKFSGGNGAKGVAWFDTKKTHPVAQKNANELGLYDMSGNVWEWCSDWYGKYGSQAETNPTGPASGAYRVNRGGSWDNSATYCRTSNRNNSVVAGKSDHLGLRLVLSE